MSNNRVNEHTYILLFLRMLAGLVSIAPPLSAKTYRVPSSYCATISQALELALDGDTIAILPGTYAETLEFPDKNLTLCALDEDDGQTARPVVLQGDFNGSIVRIDTDRPVRIHLVDITITGGRGWGGAIYCRNGILRLTRCILRDNIGVSRGGALAGEDSLVTLVDCQVYRNRAGVGAGLYGYHCQITLANSVLRDNVTTEPVPFGSGGALAVESGSAVFMEGGLLEANHAAYTGGGIQAADSQVTILNTILAGNHAASHGGAVYARRSIVALTNCTVSDNQAPGRGSSIRAHQNTTVTLENCIFWNNQAIPQPAPSPPPLALDASSTLSAAYSVMQNGPAAVCCEQDSRLVWQEGNRDLDPLFRRPGAWCKTANVAGSRLAWQKGDYHLQPASGCIDAGNSALLHPAAAADIDGDPRILGHAVDLGADEAAGAAGDLDQNDRVDLVDLLVFGLSWLSAPDEPDWNPLCDFNGDQIINLRDWAVLAEYWRRRPAAF